MAARRPTAAEAALLDGYPEILGEVARTGRRLTRRERDGRRRLGVEAANGRVPLGVVTDLYLGETRRCWAAVTVPAARAHQVATAVLQAANDAIVAVARGYDEAQQTAVRAEEAARREFVDDLLHGSDPGRLAERAGRFGLQLTAPHVVAVVRGSEPFDDTAAHTRRLASALATRFGRPEILVATKEGLLVCVVPGDDDAVVADRIGEVLGHDRPGTVGVGRPHRGPGGVARSYDDARTALDLAARLGVPAGQVVGADLLVYQVLFRDRAAMVDLVATVLEPLRAARGGPAPLLATLRAYFATGSAAAAARDLHLSVRALTYRLARVRELTGYDPVAPAQRYTLETAVLGARVLDWPARPLPPRG